jgi:putative intracellular protease/amidase
MKILAIIFDGFEEEEAMAPFAILRRVGANLTIASTKSVVKGNHDIYLSNVTPLDEINYKDYDCLLVPGGPHYVFLRESKYVHEMINYFFNENKIVCGICAAPTIFGMLGHLKGKNYTCFTSMDDDFGGTYHDDGVVVDGNLITSRSVAYSLDFAYAIVKKTMGDAVLKALWTRIYYEE